MRVILLFSSFLLFFSCKKSKVSEVKTPFLTKNVIVVIMDGARYSETWGEANHSYIPNISNNLAPKGIINTSFYNLGFTWTSPGHLAICSGKYYNLNNGGSELPPFPNMFQYYNKTYPNNNSWIITSKDKLEVLANTSDTFYNGLYQPNTDCGVSGLGSGYRNDSITLNVALNKLTSDHPQLALINFREPDFIAHSADTLGYLNQIHKVDSFINILFSFIENDPIYKGNTTLFVTNDHGRHDNQNGGFQNHGDACDGCSHMFLYAYGPDFKKNTTVNIPREQIDIAPTIAKLLYFNIPNSDGKVMTELFK
jgi:Metalloenzyme superfamily